jgi:hypothetical protein
MVFGQSQLGASLSIAAEREEGKRETSCIDNQEVTERERREREREREKRETDRQTDRREREREV